jgi:phosphotransferase system IIB component
MMDYKQIAQNIYNVIVPCGIEDFAQCMTRLRVKTSNPSNIDISQLKKIESVLGVVNSGDEIQIILGPGTVSKVFNEFNTIVNNNYKNLQTEKKDSILINSVQTNINTTVNTNKEKNKSTLQSNIVARTLSKFAKIFTPLIPAFIAAGFLSAIAGIVQVSVDND